MKTVWYQKKWVIILLHIAFWSLLFSLPYLLNSHEASHPPPEKTTHTKDLGNYFSLAMNACWVTYFYFNAFFIIPRFIDSRRYWQFGLVQVVLLQCMVLIVSLLQKLFFDEFHLNQRGYLFSFFIYMFMFALSTAYQLISERIKADKLEQEKLNENLKTELSLLRSQVSPHFMFNVLNNMVALARKQSDLLEPSLIKLSSLMRYMLYEADEDKVSLEREIEYLQSYIDLQQQRFGKKVAVNVSLDLLHPDYQIEPMLLIPFVENAFKHGTGQIEGATIDIQLKAENNILQFTVRNKYNPNTEEIKDHSSGIGLTNVKRRLNLLYGKQHSLLISEKDNWFTVSLQIFLN
jgi:sensor histidine kinase YesM